MTQNEYLAHVDEAEARERFEKLVASKKAALRTAEKELTAEQRLLYGNNIAIMSGGKRGTRLSKRDFGIVTRNRDRLKKQIASLKRELEHLGAA